MLAAMSTDQIAITPARFSVSLRSGQMAGWRWKNEGAQPLLFCHATGFCASAYKQMLQVLSGAYDVYALDLRGHGRTQLPADPTRLRSWGVYARDAAAFLDETGGGDWVLAGHSMGGVAVTIAAAGRSDIASVKLIEPAIIPSAIGAVAHTAFWRFLAPHFPMSKGAARRRAHWPSRETAQTSYGRKKLFRPWADGMLADYLEDGLAADDGDGYRLACDPEWEAATFSAHANDFWGAVKRVSAPMAVFAARGASTTVWRSARVRLARWDIPLTQSHSLSHLAPMEDPRAIAEFVAQTPPSPRNSRKRD